MRKFLVIFISFLTLIGCSKEIEKVEETKDETKKNVEIVKEQSVSEEIVIEESDNNISITLKEEKYINLVTETYRMLSESLEVISNSFGSANANQSLLKDESWKKKLRNTFSEIDLAYQVFNQSHEVNLIPSGYEDIHEATEKSLKYYSDAGESLFDALDRDSFSIKELKHVSDLLSEGHKKLNESNELFRKKINELQD